MQKRKKVVLVLMASMMVAAALSQARASEISLEEQLNTEGKIQAAMTVTKKQEVLNELNRIMEEALDIQERVANKLNANDELLLNEIFMSDFSGMNKHIDFIGSRTDEVEQLNENQTEELQQALQDAEVSRNIIRQLLKRIELNQ